MFSCAVPAIASADILSLTLEATTGGTGGDGLGGDRSSEAFHKQAAGVSYGAAVGVEILFIDAWIEHYQLVGSDGLNGTWSQIMTGFDFQFDLGEKTRGGTVSEQGTLTGDNLYSPLFGEIGVAVGFGAGTGQQIDPPLDNSEISDKGFVVQTQASLGYRFNRFISLGLSVPVQWGYMFKNDADSAANDLSSHYRSMSYAGLLELRVRWKLR